VVPLLIATHGRSRERPIRERDLHGTGEERRGALFYVEAELRAEAVELVEGMDLTADLKPGQRARVSNQPTTDTRDLKRRP
jgi:hypothetical protein